MRASESVVSLALGLGPSGRRLLAHSRRTARSRIRSRRRRGSLDAAARGPRAPGAGVGEEGRHPGGVQKPGTTLSLAQLVDVGLRNNPRTREAWYFARAAAAEVGVKRAEYFPVVEIDGTITREKTSRRRRPVHVPPDDLRPGGVAQLAPLRLRRPDGGRRRGAGGPLRRRLGPQRRDPGRRAPDRAGLLRVPERQGARRCAREANLEEARRNLDAAEERHRAGVATIADVLQARTVGFAGAAEPAGRAGAGAGHPRRARDRGRRAGHDSGGRGRAARGSAARPGLAERRRAHRPRDARSGRISRPARFEAQAAEQHIQSVRADGLPKLFATASLSRTYYYRPVGPPVHGRLRRRDPAPHPGLHGLRHRLPTQEGAGRGEAGGRHRRANRRPGRPRVWTSYYDVQTASQRVRTSRDLLASASQSADVAQGRYKEGVGSILDLLTAQAQLANARAAGGRGALALVPVDGPARARDGRAPAAGRRRS